MKLGFDIVAAALIVLGASVTGWASISHIYELENAQHSIAIEMAPGDQAYYITQAKRCVGAIETKLIPGAALRSNFQMSLRVANDHSFTLIEGRGDAAFNPLGQLVAGHLEIKSEEGKIIIASSNANPINLAIVIKTAAENFKHTFSVPGPVALTKISNQHYELHFPKINASLGSMTPILSSFLGPSSLQIVPAQQAKACAEDQKSALVVEPANSKLQLFLQNAFKAASL